MEDLSDEDVRTAGSRSVSILLSHDVLAEINLRYSSRVSAAEENVAMQSRQRISSAMRANRPNRLLHGHWHAPYTEFISIELGFSIGPPLTKPIREKGIASNSQHVDKGFLILELDEFDPTYNAPTAETRRRRSMDTRND
jgi:hypothetical protein